MVLYYKVYTEKMALWDESETLCVLLFISEMDSQLVRWLQTRMRCEIGGADVAPAFERTY